VFVAIAPRPGATIFDPCRDQEVMPAGIESQSISFPRWKSDFAECPVDSGISPAYSRRA
jgi:hypothetical protein